MKTLLTILFVFFLFTSCKTSSVIITSKDDATKKGIYSEPVAVKKNDAKKKKNKGYLKTTKDNSEKNQTIDPKIIDINDPEIIVSKEDTSYLIEQIINSAKDNLGIRYSYGGLTRAGFDCSGLISTTFKKYAISLPRMSHDMANVGRRVDKASAKKGDLIFFTNNGGSRINHVGMIVEVNENDISFIHAANSGVTISQLKETYYSNSFRHINRIIE